MMASQSNVFEFMIFNKSGQCLFHSDFIGSVNFDKEKNV